MVHFQLKRFDRWSLKSKFSVTYWSYESAILAIFRAKKFVLVFIYCFGVVQSSSGIVFDLKGPTFGCIFAISNLKAEYMWPLNRNFGLPFYPQRGPFIQFSGLKKLFSGSFESRFGVIWGLLISGSFWALRAKFLIIYSSKYC